MSWLRSTELAGLMTNNAWAWPIAETIHFTGLVLLFGTVAAFDLRLLGIGKGIAPGKLHSQLPWGMLGLALLAVTGAAFISAAPDQYFYNDAFYVKAGGVLLLASNAGFFYLCEYRTVKRMPADAEATTRQKLIAATSLVLFAVVMCAGRMLTFFRPPGYF